MEQFDEQSSKKRILIITISTILIVAGAIFWLWWINVGSLNKARNDFFEQDMSVSLKAEASEAQVADLKKLIESQRYVRSLEYISGDQILSDLKDELGGDAILPQVKVGGLLMIKVAKSSNKQQLYELLKANDPSSIIQTIDLNQLAK